MKIPSIGGIIRRRILVNYRVQPELIQSLLPARFTPKLHDGFAIAGICLIRLEQVRPNGIPSFLGIASENAAHRFAVLWKDDEGKTREGVYISRRDTDSFLNTAAGGRIFPGEHHPASFTITDDGSRVDFKMASKDQAVVVEVCGKDSNELGSQSKFRDVAEASLFFEQGSLGYSATQKGDKLEGLRLNTLQWKVSPLEVEHVRSSFFDDRNRFPSGGIFFDCALIMRDIQHQWQSEKDLYL